MTSETAPRSPSSRGRTTPRPAVTIPMSSLVGAGRDRPRRRHSSPPPHLTPQPRLRIVQPHPAMPEPGSRNTAARGLEIAATPSIVSSVVACRRRCAAPPRPRYSISARTAASKSASESLGRQRDPPPPPLRGQHHHATPRHQHRPRTPRPQQRIMPGLRRQRRPRQRIRIRGIARRDRHHRRTRVVPHRAQLLDRIRQQRTAPRPTPTRNTRAAPRRDTPSA